MNSIIAGARHAADTASQPSVFSTSGRPRLRNAVMKRLLIDLRDKEVEKIRALVHDETMLATEASGDELDQARRDGDLEFQVSLLDLSERRLAAITYTLARLDEGRFGVCEECGLQISLTRLQSVPFARYCFDCQKEMEAASSRVRVRIIPSTWTDIFDPARPEAEQVDREPESSEESSAPPTRRRRR